MPGQQMPATQAAPTVPAREDNAVCSIVLRISWHPVPDCEGYILIYLNIVMICEWFKWVLIVIVPDSFWWFVMNGTCMKM